MQSVTSDWLSELRPHRGRAIVMAVPHRSGLSSARPRNTGLAKRTNEFVEHEVSKCGSRAPKKTRGRSGTRAKQESLSAHRQPSL
jgi:hypothetical protein